MKASKFVIGLMVVFLVAIVTSQYLGQKKTYSTKDLLPVMENLKSPFDTTAQLYKDCFILVIKPLPQSEQAIKYTWSKTDFGDGDGDTLETNLISNNSLVMIYGNEGLVLTTTVSRFWSTDNLFDGYVTWADPVWNTENPNISDQDPTESVYKYHALLFLSIEFGVFGGWNSQMPAHFINRRNGYEEEGRNIYYFQTLKPVSEFDDDPLYFWAECGNVDLRQVTGKNY